MSDTLSPAEQFAVWAQECGWDPAWSEQALAHADLDGDVDAEDGEDGPPCEPVSLADLPALDTAPLVVDARLAAVHTHLAALAVELPGAVRVMADHDLLEALAVLQRAANLTSSCDQAVVAAVDDRGLAEVFGATSTVALLIDQLLLAPGEATRRVTTARACGPRTGFTGEPLPADRAVVAAAQAAGDISSAHAVAIVRGMKQLPPGEHPDVLADVLTDVEQALTDLARHTHPGVVADAARAAVDRFAPDTAEARHRQQQHRRTLHQDHDGTGSLTGTLTPDLLAQLQAVLSPLAAPAPADANGTDSRTPGQRRHDALADMCTRLLHSGTLPQSGGAPATVAVTIPLTQLLDRTGQVTTSLGTTMSITQLLHLACEAEIVPVVLNDAGGITTHGRIKRHATQNQRKTLRARDGGCTFPGCHRPPQWCQPHHVRAWHNHGTTDIDNLALLRGHHHRTFHTWGWTVHMTDASPSGPHPPTSTPTRCRSATPPTTHPSSVCEAGRRDQVILAPTCTRAWSDLEDLISGDLTRVAELSVRTARSA